MVSTGIFTNSAGHDQVLRPYTSLIETASYIRIAVPYFTRNLEILKAAARGAKVELLVGLNRATNPSALRAVSEAENCSVRYFTDGFHAKVFLFDGVAMLGSANLTNGGLASNREAVLVLDQPGDEDRIRDLESFFAQVWNSAETLTPSDLKKFREAWDKSSRLDNPDAPFDVLRQVQPTTILVGSGHKTAAQHFRSDLQKLVYDEYKPAFDEVSSVLRDLGLRRPEFSGIGLSIETNRFLNWVRKEHAIGDDSWKNAKQLMHLERTQAVEALAKQWATTPTPDIPADYFQLLGTLQSVMGTSANLMASNRDEIVDALICVHAFKEQLRFTKGGADALPAKFWELNSQDLRRVQRSLDYLIHGNDDFAERIGTILYDPQYKLAGFGRFCALELVGTLKPNEVPPINGRMAKALRFIGYGVRAT